MHSIGQNIKHVNVSVWNSQCPGRRPSGVCGQDCDVIYGPIFTKFITLAVR